MAKAEKVASADREWSLIDDAPKDGRVIEVSADLGDETGVQAFWYTTRARVGLKWEQTGWWAFAGTKQKLPFEPEAWRPISHDWPYREPVNG